MKPRKKGNPRSKGQRLYPGVAASALEKQRELLEQALTLLCRTLKDSNIALWSLNAGKGSLARASWRQRMKKKALKAARKKALSD